ncbi:MAG: energy-coupling factor ABC transporter permease, partial [Sulfurospirillum sp.]
MIVVLLAVKSSIRNKICIYLIQAVVFGDGGISTLAANALSMAFVGSFVGYY